MRIAMDWDGWGGINMNDAPAAEIAANQSPLFPDIDKAVLAS